MDNKFKHKTISNTHNESVEKWIASEFQNHGNGTSMSMSLTLNPKKSEFNPKKYTNLNFLLYRPIPCFVQ
jgi:hypothetical protein